MEEVEEDLGMLIAEDADGVVVVDGGGLWMMEKGVEGGLD